MHPQPLIHAVVQQTMVLVAHLATFGGVRAPLARVANQIFADLTEQLTAQGVAKTVIADMFGMALSTYHRRARLAAESQTDAGRSVWEAVFDYVRDKEPVSGASILARFSRDDGGAVASVLRDLTDSGMVYRSGRGREAVYRVANPGDFASVSDASREEALRYILWLAIVRRGPLALADLAEDTRQSAAECEPLVASLVADGLVEKRTTGGRTAYESTRMVLPVGTAHGWEAAVLDHFQAVVTALCVKLRMGASRSAERDLVGGSTYTLDVWPGHPLDKEARGMLGRLREQASALRDRVDKLNETLERPADARDREVTVYVGQFVKFHDNDSEDEDNV